jgi:hypothetical protein
VVFDESVPDSVPALLDTPVLPEDFLVIRIPPSPFGAEGREKRALFPRLIAQRVMVYLRDFAETLLNHHQPRDHRGATLLKLC